MGGPGACGNSLLSAQLSCEPKIGLENKVYLEHRKACSLVICICQRRCPKARAFSLCCFVKLGPFLSPCFLASLAVASSMLVIVLEDLWGSSGTLLKMPFSREGLPGAPSGAPLRTQLPAFPLSHSLAGAQASAADPPPEVRG